MAILPCCPASSSLGVQLFLRFLRDPVVRQALHGFLSTLLQGRIGLPIMDEKLAKQKSREDILDQHVLLESCRTNHNE